jgi:hypothetical protein
MKASVMVMVMVMVMLAVLVMLAGCKPVGSEGGPCTGGGGCDVGLVCLSDVCVDPTGEGEGEGEGGEGEGEGGEGEGEGEGGEGEGEGECQGDNAAQNDRADCLSIPASACAPAADNGAVQTCDVAAAILRSGLFQAAFDCIAAIPANACASLDAEVDECFAQLTACPLPAADALCTQANDACVAGGDNGFPLAACQSDLRATNQEFRESYAVCFNNSGAAPCDGVHDDCYNVSLNLLVTGDGG